MHGRAFGTGVVRHIGSTAQCAATLLALVLPGCASIMEGRSQEIAVSTDPPGAECAFYREGGARIATVQRTPGSTLVRKTKNDIWIVCAKPGYQQAVYFNHSGGALANVVAGVLTLGISTAVDSSTGADNRYESPANIVLVPGASGAAEGLPQTFTAAAPAGSYSQQVVAGRGGVYAPGPPPRAQQPFAAAASAPVPPVAAAPAAPERAAAAPGAGTAYDGAYSGSVEVLEANAVANRRQIDVRVVNGVGTGTVRYALCDEPGAVSFTIDAAGAIRGRANTRNTVGCTERTTTLDGRMDGGQMNLVLRAPGNPQLVMSKTQGTAAAAPVAAAPPQRGRFDGAYSGPMEMTADGQRQVWLRVVGTKGTGSVRRLSCGQPGLISIAITPDGSVSGDADVLNGSCASQKVAVKGQINGTRMSVSLVLPDGQTSPEFVFTRRSYD